MEKKILVINPGSTSTKIAVFQDRCCIHEKNFAYTAEELAPFPSIISQKNFRLRQILEYLSSIELDCSQLSAVVGRGGAIGPVESGAYLVNELLFDRLAYRPVGEHASNLGGILAYEIASMAGIPAMVYDGVTVDELNDMARMTGLKGICRFSRCHALNMRAAAIQTAAELGRKYAECNFIVAHMGGGTTMSAHLHGRMTDVLIDSEGPLSAERSGGLPATTLLKYMIRENLSPQEMLKLTRGKGGMVSLLGTNSILEVERRAKEGDPDAELALNTMCYQTAKGICQLSAALCGKIDRIILTGAVAKSEMITETIIKRISFLAPVVVVPGEHEMEALALGALRVLNGEEQAHEYTAETDDIDPKMI